MTSFDASDFDFVYGFVDIVSCYGMFLWLTQSIHECKVMYQKVIDSVQAPLCVVELLLTSLVKIVMLYSTSHYFKPSIIRQTLEQALTLFPSNALFLHNYCINEQRSKIENRTNLYFNSFKKFKHF
jgi:hypothetical protein